MRQRATLQHRSQDESLKDFVMDPSANLNTSFSFDWQTILFSFYQSNIETYFFHHIFFSSVILFFVARIRMFALFRFTFIFKG